MTTHTINPRAIAALLAMLCIGTLHTVSAKSRLTIERVEPSNWWTGMANPEVQLLVHGEGVAAYTPSVDYDGVDLKTVHTTDNANYLFLDLEIGRAAQPGSFDITFRDAKGKVAATYSYTLLRRQPGSASRKGFDAADAVYLIMPDRFANGNPNNDNIDGMLERANRNDGYGRHGGDLEGIRQNLDYIADLGMTAVWLTPVLENDMEASSYHGYAITDYYTVDARLGTLGEYRNLVDMCHQKGLKMIMDFVFNHCGTNTWWMQDLPCRDWIFQWDGRPERSSYRLSTVSDPHVSKADLRTAVEGWFDDTMADLNLGNPYVRNYLIQCSIWWIETVGLDGIRQDTYPYSDKQAMAEWNRRVRAEYPDFNIVGEAWISQPSKLCYWQKDYPNADGFNSELPTIMDFPLQEAIGRAFTEPAGWDTGLQRLYDVLADDHLYPNPLNMLVFGENHDVGRLLNLVGGSPDNLRLAYALLATVRGIPQLYSGTEVLMQGNGFDGHCFIREEFPGGFGQSDNYLSAQGRSGEVARMHDYTARLFQYRKTSPALQRGRLVHFLPRDNVYVYFRLEGDEAVMVVLSCADGAQTLDGGRFAEILDGYSGARDILTDTEYESLKEFTVEGRRAYVLELHR